MVLSVRRGEGIQYVQEEGCTGLDERVGEGRECSTDSRRPAVRWRGSDGERKEGRGDKKMW